MKRYFILMITAIMSLAAMAQVKVTGTVYEMGDEPVIGASVKEKGGNQGVATDFDGNFTLTVSNPNATLIVSSVGMKTQEIALNGRTQITVELQENAEVLDEVVVVGYAVQKKINATGSVRTIDNEVLESRPLTNAVQGLQGAVAGLNITNDNGGELGSSMNINIRGVGSIGEGSSASPLVLIDGMEGDLSTINPADIQNISVLKDAAAASIYGSRAPFGVILVTTKSGDKSTRVTYSGNVRISQPVKVPNMVDGVTFAYMVNDAYQNIGNAAQFSASQIQKIQEFIDGKRPYATEPNVAGDDWLNQQMSYGSTNWYDVFLKKNTVSQDHNASVTGGNDKVTYYFSAGYMSQTGLFEFADEKYNRLSLSGRVNVKFNNYVGLTWTSRFININNEKPSIMNNLFYHNLGRRQITESLIMPNGEYSQRSLVYSLRDGGRQNTKTQQVFNQLNFLITPLQDWNIHIDLASRIENNPYTRQFNPIYITRPNGEPLYFSPVEGVRVRHDVNPDTGTFTVNPDAGEKYYEKAKTRVDYFSTNVYTDYSLTLGDAHNFKFLLGEQTEWYHTETDRIGHSSIQLADKPFLPGVRGDENTMISEVKKEWSSLGIFGRINYNYDDRYMAEVNMRGDAASRFPSDQRWGFFPSFSVGWNIAQEEFFNKIAQKGFQYLKLRASYGTLGNQNTTSFYPYFQKMQLQTTNAPVLGGSAASMLPVYDPYSVNMTWEKIENAGVGLDWGFFNNQLTGSFDWYQRTTKDMVGPAQPLPGIYGADAPKTNNAEMRTRGWEFEVAWRQRINKDWNYGISASLSDYTSIITKYDSPDNSIDGWYQGKKYGDIWGYHVLGIAKSDEEMKEHLANASQSSIYSGGLSLGTWGGGDLMYADLDGSGSVDWGARTLDDHGDLYVMGNSTPRFAYSFTLEAQWRFIDARAFFQGIGKRDIAIQSDNSVFFGFGGQAWQRVLQYEHLDYFRYAGSELGANMDDPYYGRLRADVNNVLVCDRFLQNGAYLRLKNVQVGFSLPENTKLSKYIRKARVYVSGENLWTTTKLRIYDPEAIGNSDADYVGKTYPQYRTWSVGLEVTF